MVRRWQVSEVVSKAKSNAESKNSRRIYLSAFLRGFFLYLMFISGFLIVTSDTAVTNTDFAQYIRIAGMMSILGFVIGYDPNLLFRFMHKIIDLTENRLDKTIQEQVGSKDNTGSPDNAPPKTS